MKNEVVILAGGRGQRLRPYTNLVPKPMLKVGSKPILEYLITNVKKHGFNKVILAVGYKGEIIEDYFKDGSDFGISIEYSYEDKPKNTAGALLQLQDKLNDHFLVLMGDHITDINLRALFDFHLQSNKMVTMTVREIENAIEYGVVKADNNIVFRIDEKPIEKMLFNVAIYAMNKRVFNYIEEGEDIVKHLLPKLLDKKEVQTYVMKNYWKDIGRVKDYEYMNEYMSLIELYFNLFK